ncbi:TrgA family protein [Lutimaribacter sp. EGI FJ00015]|uniref:TrgA family protein n=1 Tax=Lutimaribacter degradans TaxID=2945989 RepID=A0ACC5ZX26_9RHOB|nr:TrgA family protein [Lutimaribacter sp. EGI FJ00013]MCM2562488.1 TrgA family protein [Lutimaribacter sp. EGI FJ00013]MCO0613645.1 TrgA family protein [Lutimaribacter sp. EGI FJ00015]MCO0636617.1 TrgA family protein [Lutimaribacter sp. EGI FJ00014]
MTYTAARVVAALLLAITGWVASRLIMPLLPEATDFGIFEYLNAGLGAAVGWTVIGSRTGRGMSNAIGVGITAAVVLTFWGVFVQSAREMFALANKRRYDNPIEAIIGIFDIGIDYVVTMATPTVLGALVLGGILSAVLAERAARVWR